MNSKTRLKLGFRVFLLYDVWNFPIQILVRRCNIPVGGPEQIMMFWSDVGYINCNGNPDAETPVLPVQLLSPLKKALYKGDDEKVTKLLLCISDYIAGWYLYKESIK